MKYTLILILIIGYGLSVDAQIKNSIESDNLGLGLKGKVRSCTTTEYWLPKAKKNIAKKVMLSKYNYHFDNKRNLVEEGEFNDKSAMILRTTYKYDSLNDVVEEKSFYPEGGVFMKTIYIYNGKGKLLIQKKYKGDTLLQEEMSYVHNDSGLKTEMNSSRGKLKIKQVKYTYDEKNNLTQQTILDGSGKVTSTINYSYDKMNNMTKMETLDNAGSLVVAYTWIYDARKNIIEEDVIDKDDKNTNGKLSKSQNSYYKYDTNNNRTESCTGKPNVGLPQKCAVYKYEDIDKSGNWHIRTASVNNEPTNIVEREIEYY